jgi:hypothetical protein
MLELMFVATPEETGASIWQAVTVPVVVRSTVKGVEDEASVSASCPFAFKSIEKPAAKALNGKLAQRTKSITSDTVALAIWLVLNAVMFALQYLSV